jgi:predicted metal-dependent peptidase
MLAAKRGDAPGHVAREVARADHPPQDWRETLRAFFDGGAQTTETWTRPNRRFIGGGLYLPGREREGINRAVFLIDTSGSMFDGVALECVAVETQAALDERIIDEVVVVYGDTRVTRVDTYHPGDEIEFDPRGGGGTVLQPLFDHVADLSASLIVCFTDGYIDVTSDSPEPACPVLWAFTGYPEAVREHIANAPWGAAGIDVGSH